MNEPTFNSAPPLSVEEGVNVLLCNAQQNIRYRYQECEERVRQSPTTSLLGAIAVGYCLHRLPVRSILVANVRLLSALAPPALFVYGAAKVCEFLQKEAATRHP